MDAYSKEFRRDVLAACDAGGSTREVALRFGVSESWVRRVKQERREQGKVAPKSTRNRRKSWEPHAAWLLAKLDQEPDIYLRELQVAAQERSQSAWHTVSGASALRSLGDNDLPGRDAFERIHRTTVRGRRDQRPRLPGLGPTATGPLTPGGRHRGDGQPLQSQVARRGGSHRGGRR